MKERQISVITGRPSMRGSRLRSLDGKTWKQRNREAVNARRRTLYELDKPKHHFRASTYRKTNREKVNRYNAAYAVKLRARLREQMIQAYGGKCKCCGECEPTFLQLDHIHNDGSVERVTDRTTYRTQVRLKRLGWPNDRHQLLCANCNFGKMLNGGICPHVKSRF